jgi:hypothetical protein
MTHTQARQAPPAGLQPRLAVRLDQQRDNCPPCLTSATTLLLLLLLLLLLALRCLLLAQLRLAP